MILNQAYIDSPLGIIEIKATEDALLSVTFQNKAPEEHIPAFQNNLVKETANQLNAYFQKKLNIFDLPVAFDGTDFQVKVWKHLLTIPFGQVITYNQLALRLGSQLLTRAVGTANGANKIAIIVPCHRVIGKNGALTGYAGELWRKEWLLDHEGAIPRKLL